MMERPKLAVSRVVFGADSHLALGIPAPHHLTLAPDFFCDRERQNVGPRCSVCMLMK